VTVDIDSENDSIGNKGDAYYSGKQLFLRKHNPKKFRQRKHPELDKIVKEHTNDRRQKT
jgi:hypothetical protein